MVVLYVMVGMLFLVFIWLAIDSLLLHAKHRQLRELVDDIGAELMLLKHEQSLQGKQRNGFNQLMRN